MSTKADPKKTAKPKKATAKPKKATAKPKKATAKPKKATAKKTEDAEPEKAPAKKTEDAEPEKAPAKPKKTAAEKKKDAATAKANKKVERKAKKEAKAKAKAKKEAKAKSTPRDDRLSSHEDKIMRTLKRNKKPLTLRTIADKVFPKEAAEKLGKYKAPGKANNGEDKAYRWIVNGVRKPRALGWIESTPEGYLITDAGRTVEYEVKDRVSAEEKAKAKKAKAKKAKAPAKRAGDKPGTRTKKATAKKDAAPSKKDAAPSKKAVKKVTKLKHTATLADIRTWRKENGVTVSKIAKAANLDRARLAKVFAGKEKPENGDLKAVRAACKKLAA